MRVILTGGGTGGHIYPAIAIAERIKKDISNSEILYVGCENGLERDIVGKTELPFTAIHARGLPRKLNKDVFAAIFDTGRGVFEADRMIKKFRPDLVIGTGGYVCGPTVLAARRRHIPALLHEQNAYPGITNRLLAPFVDQVLLNFTEARGYFKGHPSFALTGLPVREDIANSRREEGAERFGLDPNKRTVLITGGSRGARTINRVLALAMPLLLSSVDAQIIFATGTNGYAETMLLLKDGGINPAENPRLVVKDYLYEMPLALAASDVIIGRAGATFLAEIAMCGIPGILVPYPYASENHQVFNAQAVVDAGAAEMILDKELTVPRLLETLTPFLQDDNYYHNMATQMKSLARPEAMDDIMAIVRRYA